MKMQLVFLGVQTYRAIRADIKTSIFLKTICVYEVPEPS